ncbi:MAG: shikimate kinase [Spongiibacteraceae bacterium]|nr:shikimate kinase [Spongiibacteraceae bacterium]
MSRPHHSVVLIGMPGAGKSTTGILLAKNTGLDFVDTDIAIQTREDKTLQTIIKDAGYLALREIEEQVILDTSCEKRVIATGGSAVYSDTAMKHLKQLATVVYLNVDLNTLRQRIHNYDNRGIAMAPNQSFDDLYRERSKLYQHYADICINSSQQNPEQTTAAIEQALKKNIH